MMFYNYINEEKQNQLKDWQEYISRNKMLYNAVEILKKIESKGKSAYIVGGTVRDIILGENPKDIDIATNMNIKEIEDLFNKVYDIGKSKDFGIVVVKQGGYDYEVANFRQDGTYTDGRRPDSINIVLDFKSDASRRDLRLNAMGLDSKGNIIDYFDGQKDIKNKILRTVGDPKKRFDEDKLRMLRTVRFASKLNFDIESETKSTIKDMASDITKVSPERIRDELVKMASQTGDKFANAILLLDETGILNIILPEITKLKEFKEEQKHHPEAYEYGKGRVFDHVIAALRKNKLSDPLINLSILMHDVGKGVTFQKIDGESTFRGHASEAKNIIDVIAKRLRLTNKEKDAMMFSALNHMKMPYALHMKPTKILQLVNDENWEVLKAVSYCDDACRIGLFDKKKFDEIINNMEKIAKRWGDKTTNKVAKIVDGEKVMKLLKIRPSKLVGDIIKKVTDDIINKGSKENIEDLIKKAYEVLK